MKIGMQAKKQAKEILFRYGIIFPTLENLLFIIEDQGYEILEYSNHDTTSATFQIIERLNLSSLASIGQAFTYKNGEIRVVFICEELNANEKLYALSHELGHMMLGHMNNGYWGDNIEQEYLANEFAHYLLNSSFFLKTLVWTKRHTVSIRIAFISTFLIAAIIFAFMKILPKNASQGSFYITHEGERYHQKECIFIKNKTNIRKMTEKELESEDYTPCQICLPE